jgi:DNA polymerase-3 subunit delta'
VSEPAYTFSLDLGFDGLVDQQRAAGLLRRWLASGHIPQAVLLTGIAGIGKAAAATLFAMACNCRQVMVGQEETERTSPCGRCRPCRRTRNGTHPDVLTVAPIGAVIRIDQIRTVTQTLGMRPYEARRRVVVIDGAQHLHPSAANALLKTLEEPPANTVLVLTAPQASDLLPTVVSRCQHVHLRAIRSSEIRRILIADLGAVPEWADVTAGMAGGSLLRAARMAAPGWKARRDWFLSELAEISGHPAQRLLALAERLAADKDHLDQYLEVAGSWYRDALVARFAPDRIINMDLAEKIRYVSAQTTIDALLAQLKAVLEIEKALKANLNIRLALEKLLLFLANPQAVPAPETP